MDKYKYSYERTPNYCFSNTDVLINKFDIHDEETLSRYERQLVAIRQAELIENPIMGNLDFLHLKSIHKHLFQDLYFWAGESRNCNISKRDLFCLAQHIDSYSFTIFEKLRKEYYFVGQGIDDLIVSLVDLLGDINALHPFREGNGRSQREFTNMIARINGINISFINVTAEDMIEGSHNLNNGDRNLMKKIFLNNYETIGIEEQMEYIQKYVLDEDIKRDFERSLVTNDLKMK